MLLSKGHAAPALYSVLRARGIISKRSYESFHNNGTLLPVHVPHDLVKDEFPFSSGSLGHGLSLCAGIAHAKKLQKKPGRTFCILSDGECNEGQVWEAAQYASHFKLSSLIAFIDVNGIQAFGKTKDVIGDVTAKKWKAFGWDTYECNGHSIDMLMKTVRNIQKSQNPKVILCHTIKGYGLSFFENTISSHYEHLSEKQFTKGLLDFNSL